MRAPIASCGQDAERRASDAEQELEAARKLQELMAASAEAAEAEAKRSLGALRAQQQQQQEHGTAALGVGGDAPSGGDGEGGSVQELAAAVAAARERADAAERRRGERQQRLEAAEAEAEAAEVAAEAVTGVEEQEGRLRDAKERLQVGPGGRGGGRLDAWAQLACISGFLQYGLYGMIPRRVLCSTASIECSGCLGSFLCKPNRMYVLPRALRLSLLTKIMQELRAGLIAAREAEEAAAQ